MNTNFIEKYREFLQIISNYENTSSLSTNDEDIMNYGQEFLEEINSSSKLKQYLLQRNIKCFSTNKKKGTKLSIHPSINIKRVISSIDQDEKNQENVKNVWNFLQMLYVIMEVENPSATVESKKFVNDILSDLENNKIEEGESISEKLNIQNMMKDIGNTFKQVSAQNPPKEKIESKDTMESLFCGDTLNSMIKTSQIMAEKYQTKIENGDLSIEDMMGSLTQMLSSSDNPEFMEMFNSFDPSLNHEEQKQKQMEEYVVNQKMSVSKEEITEMSGKLKKEISNIGTNIEELSDKTGDVNKLLSSLNNFSQNSPL